MRRMRVLVVIGTIGMVAVQAVPALASQKQGSGSGQTGEVAITATRRDTSPPLTSITPVAPRPGKAHAARKRHGQFQDIAETPQDQANPTAPSTTTAPSTPTSWEGIHNINGVLPPDTNGDVGPNNYVQWVNLSYQVWNKSGTSLYGPVSGSTLWSGLGGLCQSTNEGDPIVLYDKLSDRWLLSQFAFNTDSGGNPVAPFHQCIAVSKTGDPTGSFYRYDYNLGSLMNDYPKFGVWPDGYYMSTNLFNGNGTFAGVGVLAYDRTNMLQGNSATAIEFQLGGAYEGILPANFDGTAASAPPAGEPETFAGIDTTSSTGTSLQLWHFVPNYSTPTASTFGTSTNAPDSPLSVPTYTSNLCSYGACVVQPGTSQRLDTLSDRLMNRLEYRRFADHESLVVNHTVNVGSNLAGIRWYEVRNPSAPTLYQSGTYAPDAGSSNPTQRWMASAALDSAGNLAIGYSASSSSVYPSIRYTYRQPGDPLGTLSSSETTIVAGGGSELAYGRWGDYSSMSVDPSDDCTFWYTQEYYAASSNAGWQTRIANFKLPGCGTAATSTSLASSPNPSTTGQAVQLTATVSGSGSAAPTGSVVFSDGTTSLGSAPLSGSTATLSVSTLAAGSHSLTATYQGDTVNAASTSTPPLTQTVTSPPKTASTTALASSANPSAAGSSVTFTATVSGSAGTPTGPVTFADGSTTLGTSTLDSTATATFTTSTLASGNHSVTATYGGDGTYATSSAALTQSVTAIATSTSLTSSTNPSTATQAVTLTATVSPPDSPGPSGTVTFKDGSTTVGTATVSASTAQATLTTSGLTVGQHSLTASYSGDSYHGASASPPMTQVVNPAPGGVVNGGFETGTLMGWTPAGTTALVSPGHTGTYAARVGGTSPTNGDSSVSQTFTVQAGTSTLRLSYMVVCPDTVRYDWATVTVRDNTTGKTTTVVAKTCTNSGSWKTASAAVTAGHSVTVKLVSHDDNYPGDPTYTLYDDVTVS